MRATLAFVLAAASLTLLSATPRAQAPPFDLVIRNGRIVDGTGSPWYLGDVAVRADIAVFDPATVRDTATFERPHQDAEGVAWVIVNGEIAFENGAMTPARPGRILFGAARRP